MDVFCVFKKLFASKNEFLEVTISKFFDFNHCEQGTSEAISNNTILEFVSLKNLTMTNK